MSVYVIKEKSTMLRSFSNSLITRTFYTCRFYFIFSMWDFILFLICAGDVAACGASAHVVKTRPLIIIYGWAGGGGV